MKTIGVIGLGSIGERHAKNLIALRGNTVLTHDPKNGDDDDNLKDLIKKSDAVVIASPTSMHSQHIKMALDAKKPIFCEKPVANHNMPEAAKVDMVGYNLRFHSCVLQAKEWIDNGFLGRHLWANFVCAQYNDRYAYRKDGVILNWSHEIDLALHLLGPAFVKSSTANIDESLADITLLHENLCQSTIHLDYLTLPEIRQTLIVGEKSTIIIDLVNRHCWCRNTLGTIVAHYEGNDSWDSNYKDEMETFLARIDGQETVGCTGKEGLDALNICLGAKVLGVLQ